VGETCFLPMFFILHRFSGIARIKSIINEIISLYIFFLSMLLFLCCFSGTLFCSILSGIACNACQYYNRKRESGYYSFSLNEGGRVTHCKTFIRPTVVFNL